MIIQTVLFIDDEPDIRTIGRLSLETVGGWQVSVAASAEEGLRKAADGPDLILLDVMMDGTDGLATLQQLRRDEATRTIPVLIITAKVQPHEVARYFDLGADGVITKPFDPLTLPAEIEATLERGRPAGVPDD